MDMPSNSRTRVLVIVVLLLQAAPARAADTPCLRHTVIANVFDAKDEPVSGLNATAFEAHLRGKPVKGLSADLDFSSRRVNVLLDISDDMFPSRVRDLELQTARDFVAQQPLANPVAFLLFAEVVKEQLGFDQGREQILQRIEAVRADPKPARIFRGRAAVWDAIGRALETLGPSQRGDTILLYSYCFDRASRGASQEIADALLRAGIRLFIIVPPGRMTPDERVDACEITTAAKEELLRLARDSGGTFQMAGTAMISSEGDKILPPQRGEMQHMLAFFQSSIDAFYKLELELPEEIRKPQEWELKLARSPAAKKEKWQVLYPHELLPCVAGASH